MDLILEPRMTAWIPHTLLAGVAGLVWAILAIVGEYKSHWLYDNVAHFSAGASLAALASLLLTFIPALAAVLIIAIGWEFIEFTHNVFPWVKRVSPDRAWEDTLLDTLLVMAAALVASWFLQPIYPLL